MLQYLYAFQIRAGGLERGQKVLIHSGTGGVGISATNAALAHGCEVFTTKPEQQRDTEEPLPHHSG